MPFSAPMLHRQVARVRRRLLLQLLVRTLVRCWLAALLLAVVWFLAEPFLVRDALPNLRWYVLGGALSLATLLGMGLALRRRPSAVAAALLLDERFQLKERVTTSLTLDPRDLQAPAALALLADVDRRVAPLTVGDRFPVQIPWTSALVPVGVMVLVLLAFFYKPSLNQARAETKDDEKEQNLVEAADAKKKLEQMVKKVETRKDQDKPQSQEMQNIEKELDKLAHKPLDTKDQVRDALKDLTSVEDALKKRDKDMADKQEAIKQEMKQMERLAKKNKDEKKDGPADKLDNALNKGDFNKAKDEAERLSRKLKEQEQAKKDEEKAKEEVDRLKKKSKDENLSKEERAQAQKELDEAQERLERAKDEQLTKEQKEQLEEQLKEEQDKLERLTRNKEEKEADLREQEELGQIDQEELERELDQLEKNSEQAQLTEEEKEELKELAKQLGQCQKCLKEGNNAGAGEKLDQAAKLLRKLDKKGERKDIAQKLRDLQAAKRALTLSQDGNQNGPNQGGRGAGQRPQSKDEATNHEETVARSQQDRGQSQIIDHVPGQGFKGPRKPSELKEDIRRASQDAPEALDRQRLPRSASEMARGYFDKMRGPEQPAPEK